MKKKSIADKRMELKLFYEQQHFRKLKTINRITNKSTLNPDATFDNLMHIISDEDVLYQAMGNISKKTGALTPGSELDPRTVDASSPELIKELSKGLKDGTFRFKPIKRIYMDKSGKNPVPKEQMDKLIELHSKGKVTMDQVKELKARPIGISSFPDKIVQEAMRMVLTAIYEPEFARVNCNFGFRPGMGCQDAIQQIKSYVKQMDYALEGDIKGAFDNVNHTTMINILGKKIKDGKFLKLVRGGLKCGLIFLNYRQDSEVGTTQGSVVSPLLYNIYFHEFDKFIHGEFREKVNKINKEENRKDRPVNKLYNIYSKKKSGLKLKGKLVKYADYVAKFGKEGTMVPELQKELQSTIRKYKELDRLQKKVPAFAKSRQTIRYWYTRYADDWVFFTNAELSRVEEWKSMFTEWIKQELHLTVSSEKTKLTSLRDDQKVRFLGFQLARQEKGKYRKVGDYKYIKTNKVKRRVKVKVKVKDRTGIVYRTRAANPNLIVAWDRERILPRLEDNKFIKKVGRTWRGRSKTPWIALTVPEIIMRYNYVIRGYINYYTPVVDYPTDTHFLHYLLTYSCAHTIAQKMNLTLRKVFKKYGKNIKINYTEKAKIKDKKGNETVTEVKKSVELLNWKKITSIIEGIITDTRKKQNEKKSIATVWRAVDEICNVKVNWRTKYKLTKHCAICGSEDHVEYHHVKHVRKGRVTGFLQILKQLNRRQIPCCRYCHRKIHRGEYDGIALNDLYDEELIIL